MFIIGCSKDSKENKALKLDTGEILEGKIHTNKESNKKISWDINNCNKEDIIIKIILNDEVVFEDSVLKGEFNLDNENVDYFVTFKNNTNDNINPIINCKYTRLGMSGTITNTITNDILLTKKEK